MTLEESLCRNLERFFAFSGHALFFPREEDSREPVWVAAEKKLFLPLVWNGEFLAILLLEGACPAEIKKIFSFLDRVTAACLKIVALEKYAVEDAATGLSAEGALFEHVEAEVETLREILADPTRVEKPFNRVCFGLCALVWHEAHAAAREYDYQFCERVFRELGRGVRRNLPPGALAAPMGRFDGKYEFGIIFPAAGRKACQKLIASIFAEFDKTEIIEPLSKKRAPVVFHAGHALYPQDMAGEELRLPVFEQIVRLKERARLASQMARSSNAPERSLSFAEVLYKAGKIIGEERGGLLRINLGALANAREGARFLAATPDGVEVGEIMLTRVRARDSFAEIIYSAQAGVPPAPGHVLTPLKPAKTGEISASAAGAEEFAERAEFCGHAEFLTGFADGSRASSRFVLSVCKLAEAPETRAAEDFFAAAEFFTYGEGRVVYTPALAARHGENGLIFFHQDRDARECRPFYLKLAGEAKKRNLILACGLFEWPFLNFAKNRAETCAFKALEYAWLLPEPKIGVFDSLALNISADKNYHRGDAYKAREEYEQALLADPENWLARNSLGVCLAAMGKLDEAMEHFQNALANCDDNSLKAKICYNLGALYQKRKDEKNARVHFRRSLKYDEKHVYSWLKLGQLYESAGKRMNARKLYERALALGAEDRESASVAQRYLARLDAAMAETKKARSRLHDLLERNPEDAASMTLLAQIYLKNRDDPELAEFLARKSAGLSDRPEAWRTLAEALAAQGKGEEAEAAGRRAEKSFRSR